MDVIKPALSEQEWADYTEWRTSSPKVEFTGGPYIKGSSPFLKIRWEQLSRHAAAAVYLHEQPYGFTREDIRLVRAAAGREGTVR